MTGTPSKDRAEARAGEAKELLVRYEYLLRGTGTKDEIFVSLISEALATSFAEGMKRAAEIARDHSFGRDVDWWLNATKKDVSAEACNSVAGAILAEIGEA